MNDIVDKIEDIKQLIPDQNYIGIMESLMNIFHDKEDSGEIQNGIKVIRENHQFRGEEIHCTTMTWYKDGEIHRDEGHGPAIKVYENEYLVCEEWYTNGKKNRKAVDGPARIMYLQGHSMFMEKWIKDRIVCKQWIEDNVMLRVTTYDIYGVKCEQWFNHHGLHRDNGPAVIHYHFKQGPTVKKEIWYKDGVILEKIITV